MVQSIMSRLLRTIHSSAQIEKQQPGGGSGTLLRSWVISGYAGSSGI